jgi:hypothetical protein
MTPRTTPPQPIPSDQALRIARLDGEKAYRDLSIYRAVVALEADGWHVDYEFKDPGLSGGGPHYVIDPMTGTILTKRYEQSSSSLMGCAMARMTYGKTSIPNSLTKYYFRFVFLSCKQSA